MQKYFSKNLKKPVKNSKQQAQINRFWGNATRLEHKNIRGGNKGKK